LLVEGVQTRRTLPKSIQIGNVRGTKRGTKIDLVEGGEAEGDGAPQSHYRSKPNQLDWFRLSLSARTTLGWLASVGA
jgi:hypothetical protein